MPKRLQTYEGEHITVTFDPNLCTHSARCLAGHPAVFDVRRRKWIDVSAAPADVIARVIDRCPSRALRYTLPDGAASPAAEDEDAAVTVVTLGTDGPLMLEGRIRVQTPRGEIVRETDRVSLCRCGGTRNQPFCDGSHLTVGFKSTR
jgi:uncharacterized Fe-S cluster protein YjdI